MPRKRPGVPSRGSISIDSVVADFGREVLVKLRTGHGSAEDHLRNPFERMLVAIGKGLGLPVAMIGETRLPDLSIRPDYAVNVGGVRVGYVELKRPGHGIPTTWASPSNHDREQWTQLQRLPNVLYSDGGSFGLYTFGKLQGKVARLNPPLESAGSDLRVADTTFARVLSEFLLWEPERPRTLDELVRLVANLCRLLRDDVSAELEHERNGVADSRTFTELATDWRQVLFPNLTDAQFADQYAQTVTFALLLARVEGVSFHGQSIAEIARLLGKKHSLMGRALTVLTDQPEDDRSVALTTMIRVLSVVDWSDYPDDSYALLYENFLAKYDPALRRKSGVYYTPAAIVSFMTRFVDEILRSRLRRPLGFAEKDVIVVDPAMGTGSFLAEVVNTVAMTIADEEGVGAVPSHLRELSNRLIGFENQAAPFAVAELRIHGLLKKQHRAEIPAKERRFLADTLDDPDLQMLPLGRMYEVIERSRRGANKVKREEPVMVVIGNPPYVDKVKGTARWIEAPNPTMSTPSLSAFRKPGSGQLEYVLANKYVYFWRWASWKVFDTHEEHPAGVVAMVCSSGFTTGPGFAGMREYLRRTADEGWIVNLTPEGHQPPKETRFFRGNQQPICIAVFIRQGEPDPETPARVHVSSVSGSVEEKATSLRSLSVDAGAWATCDDAWSTPFRGRKTSTWTTMPSLSDLLPYYAPGMKPNRTWVYAPDPEILKARWRALMAAPANEKSSLLKETSSTRMTSMPAVVAGMTPHVGPLSSEGPTSRCPEPIRIGHRSFDRKWVIPDTRLHHRPSPTLWESMSDRQIFIVEQHSQPLKSGPGFVFSSLIPDMDHFMGHHGGRVTPLYRDGRCRVANVAPGLLEYLSGVLDVEVGEQDLVAYLAGVAANRAFSRIYAEGLRVPGVRIPLTGSPERWSEAVELGREVVWLHTYGERFVDPAMGRPRRSPRIPGRSPKVRKAISDTEGEMPELMEYKAESESLHIGNGVISPVGSDVIDYRVNGMRVVEHWFRYRKKRPAGKRTSALDDIVATSWSSSMTTELLDLLNVLGRCALLESRQSKVLERIAAGPVVTLDDLRRASILPIRDVARRIPRPRQPLTLFSENLE